MTVKEIIQQAGDVPIRFTTADGKQFEVDVIENPHDFSIFIWQVATNKESGRILTFATGATLEKARVALVRKLDKFQLN